MKSTIRSFVAFMLFSAMRICSQTLLFDFDVSQYSEANNVGVLPQPEEVLNGSNEQFYETYIYNNKYVIIDIRTGLKTEIAIPAQAQYLQNDMIVFSKNWFDTDTNWEMITTHYIGDSCTFKIYDYSTNSITFEASGYPSVFIYNNSTFLRSYSSNRIKVWKCRDNIAITTSDLPNHSLSKTRTGESVQAFIELNPYFLKNDRAIFNLSGQSIQGLTSQFSNKTGAGFFISKRISSQK